MADEDLLPDANWDLMPAALRTPLLLYIADGIIAPDSFLQWVLANHLENSIFVADETNLRRLPDIVRFLYNYVPRKAWGSGEAIADWQHVGGMNGKAALARVFA